jgi:DNA-binding NtrC family response regulator
MRRTENKMFRRTKGDSKMETLHTLVKKSIDKRPRREETKKILLIDNETNSALATALGREGHHVVRCDCVQKAWNLVYPQRPHLIILSIHKSDGAALSDVHECRALAGGVPIVLASSAHISRDLLNALPRGAAAVVADSLTPESARAMLENPQPSTTNH